MADFDLEQLKTLFENLGDRLEKTKGDQLSRDELYRIRAVLTKMSAQATKQGNSTTPSSSSDNKTLINDLMKEMRKAQAPKPGRPAPRHDEVPTKRRGTIIQEEKNFRKGGTDGNTILDQILRNAGKEANEFSGEMDKAEKTTKTFSERMASSTTSFGVVANAAKDFAQKMLGAGAERVDYYRELLASGEGTVSSMQDMGRQAAAAGMTVEQFVKAMTEGTQGARQLGAIKFGDVRKSVVEMSKASGYMGMLPDQITQVTSTYAEILRMQGAGQNRSSEQMANGIINLVKTSETTAHILGKTREDALEAQKLAAADSQFNAVADSKGFNADTANAVRDIFKNNFGDVGVQAITDQMTFGQVVNKPAADLVATNPDLQRVLKLSEDMLKSGANQQDVQVAVARALKDNGAQLANNKGQQLQYAQIAQLEGNEIGGALKANLQNRFVSQSNNTDKNNNVATNQNQNEEQRAGVGALQVAESFQKAKVTVDAAMTAVFNPMIDVWGPKLRDTILPGMDAFNERLTRGAIDASSHTTAMATLGTAILAVAGGLTLFTGALTIAGKSMSLLNGLRGAAGAAGSGGGAAAGGAARTALGVGARVAGGVVGGGFMAYEGGKMVHDRKDESFLGTGKNEKGFFGSRSNGYAASAGGGALAGAAIGSIVPVIGTAVGAAIGGLAGLGYATWNDDGSQGGAAKKPQPNMDKKKPQPGQLPAPDIDKKPPPPLLQPRPVNATQAPESARVGSNPPVQRPRNNPANATGQKGKVSLSADQMTGKIMEASERSANYLKGIKDNSDKHLEAVREEIAVMRSMSDRLGRLLEDGNKNTKSIADHSL